MLPTFLIYYEHSSEVSEKLEMKQNDSSIRSVQPFSILSICSVKPSTLRVRKMKHSRRLT